MDITSDKLAL
jgi:molecular chaperone DnaK